MPDDGRDSPFSGLSPKPLWQSRNDRLIPLGDPTNQRREAWIAKLGARGADDDLLLSHPGEPLASS